MEYTKQTMETVNCDLCGSSEYSIVYEARYNQEKDADIIQKFRSSGDERLIDRVVKCKRCHLVYVNPRLQGSYITTGYTEGSDENFISQAAARERTFSRSLKLIEKYYPKKGKILDVGTAGGSFLQAAKKRNWDVYGCELNKWLCDWSKKHYGLHITPGSVFDQRYAAESFDVVTLWDVLEHTLNPKDTLKECNRILKKDGLLVVNYHDFGSWIAKGMGRRWVFLLSVHLYYFTPKTINSMLVKTGYKIVKIKPHFQSLELGYLLFRMKKYSRVLSGLLTPIAKVTRMEKVQIPYWLGQTLVIAKKI